MAEIYCIACRKGGIGKTTTALNFAAELTRRGYRVLAIDMDTQCNMTQTAGGEIGGRSIIGILLRQCTAAEAIQHCEEMDLIPGDVTMNGLDETLRDVGREYRLREALDPVKDDYDYIIIDCPPALGLATTNAMTAADKLVIPALTDVYSLDAVAATYRAWQSVQAYTNRDLVIDGILLTHYDQRVVLTREVLKKFKSLAEKMGTKVYNSKIRNNISIKEAAAAKKSVAAWKEDSHGAEDYNMWFKEVIGK